MLVSSVVHCIAVLIFHLCGVQTLSLIPGCPASCTCEETHLVSCASVGLSKAPSYIPASATALDLSHNVLHSLAPLGSRHMPLRGLQYLWLGSNSLESLSMCSGIQDIVGTRTLIRGKQRCVSWAPDLQSLSADRNQLKRLPRGLGAIKRLKVLQLSHNRISELGPADLAGCTHLNELHLQHNLISTIHPEAFKDVQKLKVIDVSYNLLATIPVPAYLYLRNLNVMADISGNRWKCDCNLKTLRRWLAFDKELGNPVWEVMCFFPSHHAGKNLLYLKESDLVCQQPVYNTLGVKKEVTVDEGMELSLSCSTASKDFTQTRWWTPHGQISDNQHFLYITNTTEHDKGLYICVFGYQEEHVSVFNVHVHKRAHDGRLRREAPSESFQLNGEDDDNIERNVPALRTVQQSDLVLAVCLSILFTFIVAFILGVILRPYLEKCYKHIRNKRNSTASASNSQTSSTSQRPYVNDGYSDTEDQEQEVREGPRVTFGAVTEIQEQGAVPYYITADDNPTGNETDVKKKYSKKKRESLTDNIEVHKEVPVRQENKESTGPRSTKSPSAERSKKMQFEYIRDPEDTTELEEMGTSRSPSFSGEGKEQQRFYERKESTEQSVDSPRVSLYDEDERAISDHQEALPGFIMAPFPLKLSESKEESVDELDPDLWNDSGESFSFTEGSPRSSIRISHVASLGYPQIQKEMSVDEPAGTPGSCNSSESGESAKEPSEHIFNQENEEDSETQTSFSEKEDLYLGENRFSSFEDDDLTEDQNTGRGAQFRQDTITLDPSDIHMTQTRGDSFDDEHFTEQREHFNSSNFSNDYEDEPAQYHLHPVYRSSQKTISLIEDDRLRTNSCNGEDEDEQGNHLRRREIMLEHKVPSTDESERPFVISSFDDHILGQIEPTLEPIPKVKRYLHFSQRWSYPANQVPKVKQYIQFPPAISQLSDHSTSSTSITQVPMPEAMSESPSDTIRIFFEGQSTSIPTVPKVQRYVQFTKSEPRAMHEFTPTSKRDSLFGQIPISFDKVPKVRRHMLFSQSEPHYQALTPERSSRKIHLPSTDHITHETRTSLAVGKGHAKPDNVGDNFFGQIDASIDNVPKVKQYIQFSPALSQFSDHSTHSASITQVPRPEAMSESPSEPIRISFEGQSTTIPTVPKVQKYIQFTKSEPQAMHEFTPTIKRDGFFGQIPISFDKVPKVRRHMLFSHLEPHYRVLTPEHSSRKIHLPNTDHIRHETRTSLAVGKDHAKPYNVGDNFFGQIEASIDNVPKVKRYIQFSPALSQLSDHSTRSASIKQVAQTEAVSESPSDTIRIFFKGQSTSIPTVPKVQRYVQFTKSEPRAMHEFTPTSKRDSLFGQIPISFDKVPKVRRHMLFSQSEPHYQAFRPERSSRKIHLPSTDHITHETRTSLAVGKGHAKPDNVGDNFFGQIEASIDNVPKVKRYIQFSPALSQFSDHSPRSASITQVPMPEAMSESPSEPIRIFFEGQSTTIPTVPKVQKYIQFTKSEPQTMHEFTPTIKRDGFFGQIPISFDKVPKVRRHMLFSHLEPHYRVLTPEQSSRKIHLPNTDHIRHETRTSLAVGKDHAKPYNVGDNFFGQIEASIDNVPKVKQYIQFSPALSQLSDHSTRSASITQVPMPEAISDSPSDTIRIFFEGQSTSIPTVPKVQRYVQFTKSEPRAMHEFTPTFKRDSFFGQIPITLDKVPKVRRHMLFSQSEPHYQALTPERSSRKIHLPSPDHITHETRTSLAVGKGHAKPDNVGDNFFGQIEASIDNVPKVKQYIQFSPALSQLSDHSTRSASIKQVAQTEAVSESPSEPIRIFFKGQSTSIPTVPKVQRYVQFTKSELQAMHEFTPTFKRDGFFGQIPISFDKVPKVRRHMLFSQSEPHQILTPARPSRKIYRPSTDHLIHELRKSLAVGKDHAKPDDVGDNLFGHIYASFDDLPKVKRYIHFSPLVSQLSDALPASITQVVRPETMPKTEATSDTNRIFFEGQSKSVPTVPKVQSNVQFMQSEPQTMHQFTPSFKRDSFFGQIPISLDGVPKVKRHIQFLQVEPPDCPSVKKYQPNDDQITYEIKESLVTGKDNVTLNNVGDNFIPTSSTKIHSPILETVGSPSIKGGNLFLQIDTSLHEVPKLKRYIQFTQAETHFPPPSLHSLTNRTEKPMNSSSESKTKGLAEADYIKPTAGEQLFFGPIVELSAIPKVKRYVQFSQRPPTQPSFHSRKTPLLTKPELRTSSSSPVDKSNGEDTFFNKMDSSGHELPKVKRYLQFTQQHYSIPTKSANTPGVKVDATKKTELQRPDLPMVDIKPSVREDNFFGQPGINFKSLPRVKRYIEFTQSEYQNSNQTKDPQKFTSHITKSESASSRSLSNKDVLPRIQDNLFGQIGVSISEVPKVKKYIQFSPSDSYLQTGSSVNIRDQSPSPFIKAEITTPRLETRPESSSTNSSYKNKHRTVMKDGTFIGQTNTSFDEIPKVKRYLQFIQSEPQPSHRSSATPVITEYVTPKFSTKIHSTSLETEGGPSIKGDASFDGMPKLKKYIKFTQAAPYPSGQSQSSSEKITKKEWMTSSSLIENDVQPSTKDTSFFEGCASFENVPKVKKALLFTHSEYEDKTEANDKPSITDNNLLGSSYLSFNQPKVKGHSNMEQTFPFDNKFKLSKKHDTLEQEVGVPRLLRYTQFNQTEPNAPSLSPSVSLRKWEKMDAETESRRNITPERAGDRVLPQMHIRPKKTFTFKNSDHYDQNQFLSQRQDTPSLVKVTTEASRLNQDPEPKSSPFLSDFDASGHAEQAFIQVEEEFRHTSSNSSSGIKKYANTQGLSSRTTLLTTESDTTLDSKLTSSGALSNESVALQPRRHRVLDPEFLDVSQTVHDMPAASPGKEDARVYLRDSFLARQRQERRRLLFQQKKRAMDGLSLSSGSFTSQESDQ